MLTVSDEDLRKLEKTMRGMIKRKNGNARVWPFGQALLSEK